MHRPKSTPVTPLARPSAARNVSSGRERPSTARNYNVVALDTGFYPQSHPQSNEALMKKWTLQGFQWISCSDGQMPTRAVQNGQSRAGEPLYVARALSPGMTQCLGIFHPSSGRCYFFWDGREYHSNTYDILCRLPKLQSRSSPVTTSIPTLGNSLKVMTLRNPLKFSNFGRM